MTARRWRRSIVALTIVGALAVTPAPALADALPIGQCTTSSGVILAVDFSRWGGPLLRSCGTTPTTGYQLLNQGGWRTTGTQHDGPAQPPARCDRGQADALVAGTIDDVERVAQREDLREGEREHQPLARTAAHARRPHAMHGHIVDAIDIG